ncbi:MAG: hypothetical protein M3535_09800, partial [Actinomycetota bacterium]|nr:hypothetical protein [Actinomycetota bacterium]
MARVAMSYRYTVKAVDAAGNVSAESVIAHVTTPGGTGGGQPTFRSASTADAAGPRVAIPTPEGTTEGDV